MQRRGPVYAQARGQVACTHKGRRQVMSCGTRWRGAVQARKTRGRRCGARRWWQERGGLGAQGARQAGAPPACRHGGSAAGRGAHGGVTRGLLPGAGAELLGRGR